MGSAPPARLVAMTPVMTLPSAKLPAGRYGVSARVTEGGRPGNDAAFSLRRMRTFAPCSLSLAGAVVWGVGLATASGGFDTGATRGVGAGAGRGACCARFRT